MGSLHSVVWFDGLEMLVSVHCVVSSGWSIICIHGMHGGKERTLPMDNTCLPILNHGVGVELRTPCVCV